MSEALQHLSVPANEEVSVELSLTEMTDPRAPPPQPPQPPPPSSRVDLPAQPDSHPPPNYDARDFHRVDKKAYNCALVLFPTSVTLLLTNPQPVHHPGGLVLYTASTILACLSLIAALGLIYYSIFSHLGAQLLAKVQKTAMGISVATLLLAVLSRLALIMPFLPFIAVMASAILLTCLVCLSIYLAHKIKAA